MRERERGRVLQWAQQLPNDAYVADKQRRHLRRVALASPLAGGREIHKYRTVRAEYTHIHTRVCVNVWNHEYEHHFHA